MSRIRGWSAARDEGEGRGCRLVFGRGVEDPRLADSGKTEFRLRGNAEWFDVFAQR